MQESTTVFNAQEKVKEQSQKCKENILLKTRKSVSTGSREQVSTQGTKARQHVSTQGRLARQHVNTQGTLAREHVSMQGT